jgi:hypothetical protein
MTLRRVAAVALVAAGVIATTASGETQSTGGGSSVDTTVVGEAPAPTDGAVTPAPTETPGQANAVRSATDYLAFSAFSRSGLIEQLMFEEYSEADATYAVDSLNIDWNEQAAKSAASYLEMSSFSRGGLVDQLIFEGFTAEQAEHGASTTGL